MTIALMFLFFLFGAGIGAWVQEGKHLAQIRRDAIDNHPSSLGPIVDRGELL